MKRKKAGSTKLIILSILVAVIRVFTIFVSLIIGVLVWVFTSAFKQYPLISYVSTFGPNDNANNSFYYYAKNDERFVNLTICKYDIRTGEEEVVFTLDDGNSHKSISDYYGDDDNLFVVVTGKLSTNGRHSLYYHDNRSGKDQIITEVFGKIHLVRTETGIIVGIPDGYESSELKYYDLSEDESGFKIVPTLSEWVSVKEYVEPIIAQQYM